MSRNRHSGSIIRRILFLVAIPVLLTSAGYALYAQELDIDVSTAKPAYAYSENLLMTYDKVVTVYNANRWEYNVTFYITNTGTQNTNSWHLTFELPANVNGFRCWDDTVCVEDGNGFVTVDNGSSTAIILAGGSVSFTMRYRLTTDTHTIQNINVSGTYAPEYESLPGLTASYVVGSRHRHQGLFYWYHDFTVENNSGYDLDNWRIFAAWDSSYAVWPNHTDTTINYLEDTSELRILSTLPLADGDSFEFTIDIGGVNDRNWVWDPGSYYIEGNPS